MAIPSQRPILVSKSNHVLKAKKKGSCHVENT
jgi:hypothetical protein